MSGQARTHKAVIGIHRLPEPGLADLLRLAVQQCGRSDSPTNLSEVVGLAAQRLGRVLSDATVWQVADAVVDANRLPAVAGELDPLVTVNTAVMRAREEPHEALHALLVETWLTHEPEPDPYEAARPAGIEDLERADLARLTLAGRYFLLAHNVNGETLLSGRVCSLGLGGALLAEVLLTDLVRFTPVTGTFSARSRTAEPGSISPVAEGIPLRLRQPCPVRRALDHVAFDAYERVRGSLLYADILTPRESRPLLPFRRGTSGTHTLFPPSRPRLPERVFNAVTALPTTDASRLDLHDAALIALARATGLATTPGRQWWIADPIPAEQAAFRNPGLGHLLGHVKAAATTAVAVRQR